MTNRRMQARAALLGTLGHWKDGTRPGGSAITEGDVMVAIEEVVNAAVQELADTLYAQEHER